MIYILKDKRELNRRFDVACEGGVIPDPEPSIQLFFNFKT